MMNNNVLSNIAIQHFIEILQLFRFRTYILFQKQSVEATVNLRYITCRTLLKTWKGKVIPQSGRVTLSLQVKDECWKHRLGQWDPDSRAFTEVRMSN